MIKKTGFSLILAVFLVAGIFINSAAAWIPEPTDEQKEIFSKNIVPWITQTWENEIQATISGVVVGIHVKKGDSVAPDETLVEIQ